MACNARMTQWFVSRHKLEWVSHQNENDSLLVVFSFAVATHYLQIHMFKSIMTNGAFSETMSIFNTQTHIQKKQQHLYNTRTQITVFLVVLNQLLLRLLLMMMMNRCARVCVCVFALLHHTDTAKLKRLIHTHTHTYTHTRMKHFNGSPQCLSAYSLTDSHT